jgi:uncharacterized protein YdcH (DUF465 family)
LTEEDIARILDSENAEFKSLEEQHRGLEEKLAEIDSRIYLSADDEMERKKIQKLKLLKKDRMAELIREYKKTMSNN